MGLKTLYSDRPEHVHHAVTGEPMMHAAWRKLRIRSVAKVGDVKILGQIATNDHVVQIALHANGRKIPC
jgi:hypothetical protein